MHGKPFEDKTILITGGTGSLGKTLVRRLLNGVASAATPPARPHESDRSKEATFGVLSSLGVSYGLLSFVFDSPWTVERFVAAATVLGTVILAAALSVLASMRVWRAKPRELLAAQ